MIRGTASWVLACVLLQSLAIRENGFDRALEAPEEAPQAPEDEDCLKLKERRKREQRAFLGGYTRLLSVQRRIRRLHLSTQNTGPRNLTLMVVELHQRLARLSTVSLRYWERLHEQSHMGGCEEKPVPAEDLREEILALRRQGELKSLKADLQDQTTAYEEARLAKHPAPYVDEAVLTKLFPETLEDAQGPLAEEPAEKPAAKEQDAEKQQEPVAKQQEPPAKPQEPAAKQEKPADKPPQEPAAKQQEPAAKDTEKQQEPVGKQQEPPAKPQEPAAKQEKPADKPQELAANQQEPPAKQQEPAAKKQDPAAKPPKQPDPAKRQEEGQELASKEKPAAQEKAKEPSKQEEAVKEEAQRLVDRPLEATLNSQAAAKQVRSWPLAKAVVGLKKDNESNTSEVASNMSNASNLSATMVVQALVSRDTDEKITRKVVEELKQCGEDAHVQDVTLANDPTGVTLQCFFDSPNIRCSVWVLEKENRWLGNAKIRLQSFWIVALAAGLALLFIFSLYRQRMKHYANQVIGKKSKEELQRLEEEAMTAQSQDLLGGCVPSSWAVLLVDALSVFIPISNILIYALATEERADSKSEALKSLEALTKICARIHDTWMFSSICLLIFFQVVRASSALWYHPYCVYGAWGPLLYLATDISAMGDSAAILLSTWSLLYCREVRWNWMIFSFIRVIECLGRWDWGVHFYGFTKEVKEDQRMLRALSVFGLVLWVLIGSLYYVVNDDNDASRWKYAKLAPEGGDASGEGDYWQRFESIPSSMFFALLTLNKKNPLAHVFNSWYEKLLVVFVNVFCVPLFSLVSSMIGGAIMKLVLSQEAAAETGEVEAPALQDEDEAEEEDEEEDEAEEEEEEEEEEPPEIPTWQLCKEFYEQMTWEQHVHPMCIAALGFFSLFFYGLSTSNRPMKWLFVTIPVLKNDYPWAFPVVDGVVGSLFLVDWLWCLGQARDDDEVKEPRMSTWRHVAYFLASLPGIVNLLLCVLQMCVGTVMGLNDMIYLTSLCCLWRIYLLEKWLDHPFHAAADALYRCRKQLVTTGAVSLFFWFLGAHLLFFTEFSNPDKYIRLFYGSVAKAIWTSSFYLNGEWVFCDFSWTGKAVSGFFVLFGVSIVVVPMSVFTGYFLMNIQGDFYTTQWRYLQAESRDLWQLKVKPKVGESPWPEWRKHLFTMLYEHLEELDAGLKRKSRIRDSVSWRALSGPFLLFKFLSISASLIFALVTILENSEYMNTDMCDKHIQGNGLQFVKDVDTCKAIFKQVDLWEYRIDLIFLHFFGLEFLLRLVALGWRHLISELGLAEMLSLVGLLTSLTRHREDALHHVEKHHQNLALGSVVFLRLCRLISIGSYFGLLRAFRKVLWITRWSLLKSFYFLTAVWFTHAMLLHLAEMGNAQRALAGAQVLPRVHHNVSLHMEQLQAENASASALIRNNSVPVPNLMKQSERFGDYLNAMQYSLVHLTGDYPIVEYSVIGKLVLLLGLLVGTCAMAAWTAVFSSAMVNYLANEAEDVLAKAAERRMLLAIEVVLRLQRQWRRRQRAREAAQARGEVVPEHSELERSQMSWRMKIRRLVVPDTVIGRRVLLFFQATLVFNVVANMIFSFPEFGGPAFQKIDERLEVVCTFVFLVELVLKSMAGKGRQGNRWYVFRAVDFVCLVPGIVEVYQIRNHLHEFHQLDGDRLHHSDDQWIKDTGGLIKCFQMIRVVRVLFWHQWRNEVQVVVDGIRSTGPILVVPAFLSLLIWVMSSSLFVWMENVYNGPSKYFFSSVSTGMYWTSSFLIGEWTLADFSEGGGNRVCIAMVLFGIMGFGIATGILLEGVQQSITVAMVESTSFEEMDRIHKEEVSREKRKDGVRRPVLSTKQEQLRKAAKVAAMTKQMSQPAT